MKSVPAPSVAQATLFDVYAPLERYFRELGSRLGSAEPPLKLQPEDAYLLYLFVGLHESIRAVVDLAADATWGATTLLWASHRVACRVLTPAREEKPVDEPWASVLEDNLDTVTAPAPEWVAAAPGASRIDAVMTRVAGDRRPMLVLLPVTALEPGGAAAALSSIFAAHPGAIVLLLPLGLAGEDRRLDELLQWTREQEMRFTALRDLSPFLNGSRLALVGSRQDAALAETLKRIQRLFTSNFDFVTLAQQTYTATRTKGKLETQLREKSAKHEELERAFSGLEAQIHDLRDVIAALDKSANGWARECERNAEHALWLEGRLREATSGRSWSVVQGLRRLRRVLAPPNSLREGCGRLVMRVQRRLRRLVQPAR